MNRFGIIFDTETTGLLAPELADLHHQPFITEIYAAKFSLDTYEIVDEIDSLINVPVPITEEITKITGITEEMLVGKPEFSDIIPEFVELNEGVDTWVAHNLMFDHDVVYYEFKRNDIDEQFPHPFIKHCTVEMSYPIHKKRLKLGDLYQIATGKYHEGAHRAKADVLACLECYKWLVKEGF